MNVYEYELLTNNWRGARGAAYNATYEFCHQRGWLVPRRYKGLAPSDPEFSFVVTQKGYEGIKAFQSKINFKRVDVI